MEDLESVILHKRKQILVMTRVCEITKRKVSKKVSYTIPKIFDAGGVIDPKKPWYILYYYNGVRFREKFGINRIKKKAERYAVAEQYRSALEEMLKEGFNPNNVMEENIGIESILISEKFNEVLEHIKPTIAMRTWHSYHSCVKKFLEFSKKNNLITIDEVKRKNIEKYDYYLQTEKKLSAKTRGNELGYLSAIFSRFVRDELIMINPCIGVKRERKSSGEKQIPWTKEEYQTLRNYTYDDHFNVWIYCNFIYFCGTRSKETGRIKRCDVDLDNQILIVRYTGSKVKHTDTVTIPNLFIDDLKKYCKKIKPSHYLFSKDMLPGEKMQHTNRLTEVIKKIVKDEAGIKKDVYQLKHTAGILMNKMGMPKQMIQRHFRHGSVATTEIYLSNMKGYLNDDLKNKFPDINAVQD